MDNTHMGVLIDELLRQSVLSADESEFLTSLRIPYNGDADMWHRKAAIDAKVAQAVAAGTVEVAHQPPAFDAPRLHVVSDYIGEGCQGMKSMADGKQYDSRSQYYRSLKEKGLVIHESGCEPKPREVNHGSDDVLKRQIYEAMEKVNSRH